MTIRTLIVDDEPLAREKLRGLISSRGFHDVGSGAGESMISRAKARASWCSTIRPRRSTPCRSTPRAATRSTRLTQLSRRRRSRSSW